MSNLEDIVVTPDPRLQNGTKHVHFDEEEDDEDDLDAATEGEMALLGSPYSPRGRERSWGPAASRWDRVKGIVIEVSDKF